MSKLYHSVPLDEEQSLNCLPEKREWTAFNRDTVNRSVGGIQKHWTVIAHAILLSVSLTLFTISFCAKPINPSDPAVLEKFNTYCKCAELSRSTAVHVGLSC